MYYLIYAYFSEDSEERQLGSFMEVVRNFKYHRKIVVNEWYKEGIHLSTFIDHFFEHHPAAIRSRERLKLRFQKNSCEIVKLYYCHFLVRNWNQYKSLPLSNFLDSYLRTLKTSDSVPDVISQKMLYQYNLDKIINGYTDLKGILELLILFLGKSYRGGQLTMAIEDLMEQYAGYLTDFEEFFNDLRTHFQINYQAEWIYFLNKEEIECVPYESYKAG